MLYVYTFSTNTESLTEVKAWLVWRRILALHAGFPLVPDEEEGGLNNHQKEVDGDSADIGSAVPVRYRQGLLYLFQLVLEGSAWGRRKGSFLLLYKVHYVKEILKNNSRWDANLQCRCLEILFMTYYRKIITYTYFDITVYLENILMLLKDNLPVNFATLWCVN